MFKFKLVLITAVTCGYFCGNMSGCRYLSDCRSKGRKFDPGLVPYLVEIDHEILLRPFTSLWMIHEGLLSVTSKSMCTKYWLTA